MAWKVYDKTGNTVRCTLKGLEYNGTCLLYTSPQLQDAQLAVNPFKTLAKNVKELFTSEKDSDKLEKKIGDVYKRQTLCLVILRSQWVVH